MRSFTALGLSFLLLTSYACKKENVDELYANPSQKTQTQTPDEVYWNKVDSLEAINAVNTFFSIYGTIGQTLYHDDNQYITAEVIAKQDTAPFYNITSPTVQKPLPTTENTVLEQIVQDSLVIPVSSDSTVLVDSLLLPASYELPDSFGQHTYKGN